MLASSRRTLATRQEISSRYCVSLISGLSSLPRGSRLSLLESLPLLMKSACWWNDFGKQARDVCGLLAMGVKAVDDDRTAPTKNTPDVAEAVFVMEIFMGQEWR